MRLALLLSALFLLAFASAAQASSWSSAGSMATARDFHDATLLPDGRVLVSGGRDASGELRSAELYDPATGAWSSAAPMAGQRASFTTTVLADGRVLAIGGWGGVGTSGFLRSAELYDPAADAWSDAASMDGPRGHHATATLKDGKVLVTGGLGFQGALTDTAEVYDPGADDWAPVAPMAEGRFWHTATTLPDGRVLVAGGSAKSGLLASAELFDPETGKWTTAAPMADPRSNHTATTLNDGRVLVAGGNAPGTGVYSGAEIYDPVAGTWSQAGTMTSARAWHTAALLADGRVLVAGGDDGGGSVKTAEIYDPATNDWAIADEMTTDRTMHAAVALADGRVLVTGGSRGRTGTSGIPKSSSTEIYSAPGAAAGGKLVIAERRVAVRGGRTAIRFRCKGAPGTRCDATLTLQPVSGGLTSAKLFRTHFKIVAGAARTIHVSVPHASRSQLAVTRKVKVKALISSVAGGPRVAKTLTLVRG